MKPTASRVLVVLLGAIGANGSEEAFETRCRKPNRRGGDRIDVVKANVEAADPSESAMPVERRRVRTGTETANQAEPVDQSTTQRMTRLRRNWNRPLFMGGSGGFGGKTARRASHRHHPLERADLHRGFATGVNDAGDEGWVRGDVEENRYSESAEVHIGEEMLLTRGNANDEDGTFMRGYDGHVYFAWISDRAFLGRKGMDVWIKSSPDGLRWSLPWKAVQTEGEDLMSTLVRTSDGRYHLTGQIVRSAGGSLGYSTWDATSFDLKLWTKPERWTPSPYWAGGTLQEDSRGNYWLVYSTQATGYNGQRDLYIKRSTNRGGTWENPLPLITDPGDSYVFCFTIAVDGTFVLLWETHDPSDPAGYLGNSAQIYLATSLDGRSWTAPELLTPEEANAYVDTIPALIEGPGDQLYALWLSTRPYLPNTVPNQVSVVMLPVAPHRDLTDRRLVPAPGYSVRSHVLPDGRILLAWVNQSSGRAHYYYRIVSGFDFPEAVPAP